MPKRFLRPIYPHQGFALRPVKVISDGAELLHCVERKTIINCGALGRRETDGSISISKPHAGHLPNDDIAKLARFEIKEKSQSTTMAPRDILHETKVKFGVRPVMVAGSVSTINRIISRQRDEKCLDTEAADSASPVFQGRMAKDNDGDKFLLFDDVCPTTTGRHAAFASELELSVLEKSRLVLSDGTFDVARAPFKQLWCIHAQFEDSIVPVVHVLMSSRSKRDYEFVLQNLINILPNWNPTDYLGGGTMFEFWTLMKCLPFGDSSVVQQDFDDLWNLVPQPVTQNMQKFYDYIVKFYVGNNRHVSTMFPPSTWNVVSRSVRHLPRTTNTVESSHRNLERCVQSTRGRSTPLLSELLKCLRQEANKLKFDLESLNIDPSYKVSSQRKIKDELKDRRILNAITNPQGLQGVSFFKSIRAARKYN